jgi:hypothetical protein
VKLSVGFVLSLFILLVFRIPRSWDVLRRAHGLRGCRVKERTSGVIRAERALVDQAKKKGTPR